MATLTVRNLNDDIVRALRIRAAEHGRSAEAEHRDILRAALSGPGALPGRTDVIGREEALARLEEFRRRTAGRGSATVAELLQESRRDRTEKLTGPPEPE